MKNLIVNTLHRADRLAVGALALSLLMIGGAMAYNPHAEQTAPVAKVEIAAPMAAMKAAPSPAEVAAMKMLDERRCLAEAMYYEARGEGYSGQKAIAEVVFQRMHSGLYPSSICGVVYEGAHRRHGCQFSFACNGAMNERKSPVAWQRARQLAARIMTGAEPLGDLTGHALLFHAVDVQPGWADVLTPTVQIGNHVFYRNIPRTRES